jgi:hypothetical protein
MNALSRLEVLTPESPRWDEFADALCRAIERHGCDGDGHAAGWATHRRAKQIMAEMGSVDISNSLAFFEDRGGYCDCEVLLNVDDWSAIARAERRRRN